VSVVVPSHGRPDRLATLLDALALQTLPRERWEVVVVHTYPRDTTATILEGHELSRVGTLRHIRVDSPRARPSVQRNAGWRAARGAVIAFTDDDCRPEPDWLERLLERHGEAPGAIVQGTTRPDPREEHALASPHIRTLFIDPPNEVNETANILYERALLELIGGFDELATTGEDIDLGIRARDAGAAQVAAPDALVYHAIDALSMSEKIRSQRKWQHLAYVVKKHPRLRNRCEWRVWWKPEHLRAAMALVALVGAPRRPWMLVGVVPYIRLERWRHGPAKRQQLRALREVPSHWVVEVAEIATFVRGSIRYRTLLL
jgi:GT2 family glycosyltransferase